MKVHDSRWRRERDELGGGGAAVAEFRGGRVVVSGRLDVAEPAADEPSLNHGEHVEAALVGVGAADATMDGWAADGTLGVEPFVQEGPFDLAEEAGGDDVLARSETGPEVGVFGCKFAEEAFVHAALVGDLVAGREEMFNVVPYEDHDEHEWYRDDKVPVSLWLASVTTIQLEGGFITI